MAVHPTFFSGEIPLTNGVDYLKLPNGNVFGYYSYLQDEHYIYHFDLGYEYLVDANDGQGGVYLYDFASSHWWYTSQQFSFPYLYDFSLNTTLYYYPDANDRGPLHDQPALFLQFRHWRDHDASRRQRASGRVPRPPAPAAASRGR